MLRFVRTHVRWAGVLTQITGLILSHNTIFWIGTLIFAFSYVWTVAIMEEMWLKLEDISEKKDTKETNDEQDS